MQAQTDPKKRLIKLIQVGRRDLGLAEENYRAIINQYSNGRTTSSTGCSVVELERIVDHLKKCGFKVKPKAAAGRKLADSAQARKIRAMWLELHELGYVRDPSEKALAAFCKRMTRKSTDHLNGVDALQWVSADQASSLIEELKKWLARDGLKVAALARSVAVRHGRCTVDGIELLVGEDVKVPASLEHLCESIALDRKPAKENVAIVIKWLEEHADDDHV